MLLATMPSLNALLRFWISGFLPILGIFLGLSYELWLPCPAFMNSHALNLVYALKSVVKYVETALAIKVPGAGL